MNEGPSMVLAWNPIREIPAGPELLQAAEEDPRNYHTDKCKGLHLRGEGASTGGRLIWRKQK